MEDWWNLFVFRLNTGAIYLVPVNYYPFGSTVEKEAWRKLAERLSRSEEKTRHSAKLIEHMTQNSKIVKL